MQAGLLLIYFDTQLTPKTLKYILIGYAEKFLDVSLDVAGQVSPAVAFEWHSIRSDKKLLEIPSDVVSAYGTPHDKFGVVHEGHWVIAWEWKFLLQEDEERVSAFPVHVDLLQELKFRFIAIAWTDILQGQKDLFILTVFLK